MSRTTAKKIETRIDFRTTPEVKKTIQRAADLIGITMSDFVASNAYEMAKNILIEREQIQVSVQAWNAMIGTLDQPPKPNARLKAAAARFQKNYSR
ncbi:DUF1778 domain-containing protein [Bdellovibrionota bacterium FG-1]